MRRTTTAIAILAAYAWVLAACGQTATPGEDGSHHQFDDGTVFDASGLDGGTQQDADPGRPACDDGVDNDGDGLVDFPDDPGCDSAEDVDEFNPPYCGLDDQGEMIEIRTIPPTGHLVQDTENGHNHHVGSCGGSGAPEMVFSLTIAGNTSGVLINTIGAPTLLDTVVYVRKDICDASSAEVACAASTTGAGVELGLTDPAPGEYFIFVDGNVPGLSGQFLLEIRGLIPEGAPCDPSDLTLVCTPGLICAEPDTGPPTICLVPRCADGLDNDGDSIVDFPQEPGCESALDHTEDDTCPGVGCPQCADGVDNDGDSLTDWPNDPGCTCAGDPIELDECLPGLELTELPVTGTDTGPINQANPSLSAGSCTAWGMPGPETVYPLSLPFGAVRVDISMSVLGWNAYPQIYVRADDCATGTELGCVGTNGMSQETMQLDNLPPGTYYIFADSWEVYGNDTYDLSVQVYLPAGAPCDLANPLMQCGDGGTCQDIGGGTYECVPTICNNGVDDDGDGYTDYPNDPGCADINDNDELDSCDPVTNPAACPACFNGIDDDGDGLTDFPNDPGCDSAADTNELDECYPGVPVNEIPPSGTVGGTLDQSILSSTDPSCGSFTTAEDVYVLTLPYGAESVDVSLSSFDMDPLVYVRRDDCQTGTELACRNGSPAQTTMHNVAPGTLFIFADALWLYNALASYTLTVHVNLPVGAPCTVGDPLTGCALGGTCQDVGGGIYQCVGTACNNGVDDDGDGYTDYPYDPGCSSISDNDEIDSCDPVTNPAACPACFNGIDDDGDGLADDLDPGCTSAADNSELNECSPGLPFTDITSTGVGSGLPVGMDTHQGSCGWSGEPEDVYLLWLTEPAAQVDISLQGNVDYEPVVYARHGDCANASAEIGCTSADTPPWDLAELTLHDVDAGHLFIFADANYQWVTGQYNLTVSATLYAGSACDPMSTVILCPAATACVDPGGGHVCQ
jgi:predicted small secreted protein